MPRLAFDADSIEISDEIAEALQNGGARGNELTPGQPQHMEVNLDVYVGLEPKWYDRKRIEKLELPFTLHLLDTQPEIEITSQKPEQLETKKRWWKK